MFCQAAQIKNLQVNEPTVKLNSLPHRLVHSEKQPEIGDLARGCYQPQHLQVNQPNHSATFTEGEIIRGTLNRLSGFTERTFPFLS